MRHESEIAEFSESVNSLADAESKASQRVEKARLKAEETIAEARAKAVEIVEESRADAGLRKAALLKKAEENAHEECAKIIARAEGEARELKQRASSRTGVVAKQLFSELF